MRSEVYPVELLRRSTRRDSTGAYLTGVADRNETDTWIDFAKDCGYLSEVDNYRLINERRGVGAMLGSMMNNPVPFLVKDR